MEAGRHGTTAGGWTALRDAVLSVLAESGGPWGPTPAPVCGGAPAGQSPGRFPGPPAGREGVLTSDSAAAARTTAHDDHDLAVSSEDSDVERRRLIALVELARGGDRDAFGELYDHYHPSVYRFLYYRTRSATLAEDLAADTFFRALRNMEGFRWQGRDFGAWLMTIARNLATDHFKASRTRLESSTEDMTLHDDADDESVESAVMTTLTHELLMESLARLPDEQQECLLMRFLQGMSIAETAAALGRSEGAVKQLQLRGVRNLAKLVPEGIRDR